MRVFVTLVRRELGTFLNSLSGYVVIASVLLLLGVSFSDMLDKLNNTSSDLPLAELFFSTFYFWLILLLTAPVVTMRSFAAEKGSGTYEALMTAPVGDLQVVLAKYTGAMIFHLITWLPLFASILVIRSVTHEAAVLDLRALATTYLGILLVGSLYMSMGCFASALTRSQIIAAMNAFALGLGLFLLSLRSLVPMPVNTWAAKIFGYISLSEHMEDFARGFVDSRHIVFYLSFTAFFLFLTWKVVESRRWK